LVICVEMLYGIASCGVAVDARGLFAGAAVVCRLVCGTSISVFAALLKPVAITVIRTSSLRFGSITEPKMMLASSCAACWISDDASLTSCSVRSGPPVMLIRMPVAPSIETSSRSGELIAISAASPARFLPEPTPVPMSARP
jgi:hypothetical protein